MPLDRVKDSRLQPNPSKIPTPLLALASQALLNRWEQAMKIG